MHIDDNRWTHAHLSLQLNSSFQILLLFRRTFDKQFSKRVDKHRDDISPKILKLDNKVPEWVMVRLHIEWIIEIKEWTDGEYKIHKQAIKRWIFIYDERIHSKEIVKILKHNKKDIEIRRRPVKYKLPDVDRIIKKRFIKDEQYNQKDGRWEESLYERDNKIIAIDIRYNKFIY